LLRTQDIFYFCFRISIEIQKLKKSAWVAADFFIVKRNKKEVI